MVYVSPLIPCLFPQTLGHYHPLLPRLCFSLVHDFYLSFFLFLLLKILSEIMLCQKKSKTLSNYWRNNVTGGKERKSKGAYESSLYFNILFNKYSYGRQNNKRNKLSKTHPTFSRCTETQRLIIRKTRTFKNESIKTVH